MSAGGREEIMTEWYEKLGIKEYYYADDNICLIHGDCRELSLSGISAVATDPPYELGFMGKSWDSKGVSFQKETWEKIRSYCLSGAPLLSFGGSRTQHRIACAIEDAGWELRDVLMWVYGSGFPKSLDIGKAVDKSLGNEREKYLKPIAYPDSNCWGKPNSNSKGNDIGFTTQGTGDRKDMDGKGNQIKTKGNSVWEGYGTALKPAYEPIILAMNPLEKTFANNALRYGVAGINIDGCRVPLNGENTSRPIYQTQSWKNTSIAGVGSVSDDWKKGRFPANFLHDGSEEVIELFAKAGLRQAGGFPKLSEEFTGKSNITFRSGEMRNTRVNLDSGSAARFFYTAKASKSERGVANNHPTVKPLALMEYLCKLVKMPEYNLILDPFCGSGTTLLACAKLGLRAIGVDSDEQSCEIAAIRYLKAQSEASK